MAGFDKVIVDETIAAMYRWAFIACRASLHGRCLSTPNVAGYKGSWRVSRASIDNKILIERGSK